MRETQPHTKHEPRIATQSSAILKISVGRQVTLRSRCLRWHHPFATHTVAAKLECPQRSTNISPPAPNRHHHCGLGRFARVHADLKPPEILSHFQLSRK